LEEKKKPIHIAILGTRGIPARYGGFETFAEEISKRLVSRGHRLTVYKRHAFGKKGPKEIEYEGIQIISAPTVMHKYLETPLHSLFSFLDLFKRKVDVVLLCNAANSPFAWLCRLKGTPLAINVDGIERNRAKWNALGRLWYLLGERCSVWFANRVIADAKVISDYYLERYGKKTEVIAYGAKAVKKDPGEILKKFNLETRQYILYVSRLEPENNALGVIEAYNKLSPDIPLVIVGDAPYAREYIEKLKTVAGKNVIFTGYQFAEAYQELQSNCLIFIQATEVGGTHPALIEAMAYGNCVIANGTPENIEVLGESGLVYSKNNFDELSKLIEGILVDPKSISDYGEKAKKRAKEVYNWDKVTEQYEKLFMAMLSLDK
jgi:glycosyltransferase involved in cell wall biosynthesis